MKYKLWEEFKLDLQKSSFRQKFRLNKSDIVYIRQKGMRTLDKHAMDFILERLAPAEPQNDGKQTPWKGHPVFKAQHATATCCRGCVEEWYKIQKGKKLFDKQIKYLHYIIMSWIVEQYNNLNNG